MNIFFFFKVLKAQTSVTDWIVDFRHIVGSYLTFRRYSPLRAVNWAQAFRFYFNAFKIHL